jgi:hypothetical protein
MSMSKRRPENLRAGALRVKEAVNEALKSVLENCESSREEIAAELSRLVGEEISVHTLNNWCAEGKHNRRFPLEYAAALAVITGSNEVLYAALGVAGFRVLDKDQAAYYELGMITAEETDRRKRKREVMERIGL